MPQNATLSSNATCVAFNETFTAVATPQTAAVRAFKSPNAGSNIFDIDCTLSYEVAGTSDFVFQIHALHGMDQQVLSESLVLTPALPVHVASNPTMHHRFVRLQASKGSFELHYQARVRRSFGPIDEQAPEMAIADLPDDVLHNLMPTRYCESDHLSHAAQKLFGKVPHGYARIRAIIDWLQENIDYRLGSSNVTTTARDVFVNRTGVCRDYAHLAITFCRALNIPARLVVGYARFEEPPPDFHAVFEAYLGGQWVLFDPTRLSPVEELIRIAIGGDAKDVAFATIFGPARMVAMSPIVYAVE